MDEKRNAPVTGTTADEEMKEGKRQERHTRGREGEAVPVDPHEEAYRGTTARGEAETGSKEPRGETSAEKRTEPTRPREDRDPDRVREEMHQTQREMHATLEELRQRLDPHSLKDQAREGMKRKSREKANEYKQRMGTTMNRYTATGKETLKDNPIPAALVGLGVGWLVFSAMKEKKEQKMGRHYPHECRYFYNAYTGEVYEECPPEERGRAGEYKEKASGKLGQAKEKMSSTAGHYKEKMQHKAEHYTDRFRHKGREYQESTQGMGERAKYRSRRAKQGFSRGISDYPMAMGVAAMAIGSLVGLLIPESSTEDKYLGPRRDEMMEKAKETGREKMEQARHAAEESRDTFKEEMSSKSEKETV